MVVIIDSRPVAEEAIRRLGFGISPDELLDNLTAEQIETSRFVRLTYADSDPEKVREVANTVGQVASERISGETNNVNVIVYERARAP